jgi:hypothetical protein
MGFGVCTMVIKPEGGMQWHDKRNVQAIRNSADVVTKLEEQGKMVDSKGNGRKVKETQPPGVKDEE